LERGIWPLRYDRPRGIYCPIWPRASENDICWKGDSDAGDAPGDLAAGDYVIVNERKLLMRCLELIDWEAEASRTSKEAKTALDVKTVTRYAKLTEAEAKVLVVEDKWLAAIATDVQATRGLTRRRRTGV
jgi:hypothetical protein